MRPPKRIDIPENDIYNRKAFTDILIRRYFTEFDYGVLNRFRLPLFGSEPPAKRAMEIYRWNEIVELKEEGREFGEPDFILDTTHWGRRSPSVGKRSLWKKITGVE